MQETLPLPKLHTGDHSFEENSMDFVCNECGGAFEKPILATVSSGGQFEEYYACPRCMTRIINERKNIAVSEKEVKTPLAELEDSVKCNHFLGYLKSRPKDTPFPDECLTCDKMIECLIS